MLLLHVSRLNSHRAIHYIGGIYYYLFVNQSLSFQRSFFIKGKFTNLYLPPTQRVKKDDLTNTCIIKTIREEARDEGIRPANGTPSDNLP